MMRCNKWMTRIGKGWLAVFRWCI